MIERNQVWGPRAGVISIVVGCLSVCLSVWLHAWMCICLLSVMMLSVSLCSFLHVCMPVCLLACLSGFLHHCLSAVCMSVWSACLNSCKNNESHTFVRSACTKRMRLVTAWMNLFSNAAFVCSTQRGSGRSYTHTQANDWRLTINDWQLTIDDRRLTIGTVAFLSFPSGGVKRWSFGGRLKNSLCQRSQNFRQVQ